jgi:hypothetical protein
MNVSEVHQIRKIAANGPRGPSIGDVDLTMLAGIADTLSANGRGDLAAHMVEVLYYCGERRLRTDNVVPFGPPTPARRFRSA